MNASVSHSHVSEVGGQVIEVVSPNEAVFICLPDRQWPYGL